MLFYLHTVLWGSSRGGPQPHTFVFIFQLAYRASRSTTNWISFDVFIPYFMFLVLQGCREPTQTSVSMLQLHRRLLQKITLHMSMFPWTNLQHQFFFFKKKGQQLYLKGAKFTSTFAYLGETHLNLNHYLVSASKLITTTVMVAMTILVRFYFMLWWFHTDRQLSSSTSLPLLLLNGTWGENDEEGSWAKNMGIAH